MQGDVSLTGHYGVHDSEQMRYVQSNGALCGIDMNLRRECVSHGLCNVAPNRYPLADRDCTDTEVTNAVAVLEDAGVRSDFHGNVIMKMCKAV